MGGGEDEFAGEIAALCECGPEDVRKIWSSPNCIWTTRRQQRAGIRGQLAETWLKRENRTWIVKAALSIE